MKQEKNYTYEVDRRFGRAELSMNEKGKDGKYHSVSCAYPLMKAVKGKDGETRLVQCSRKETIEHLLKELA